MGKNVGDCNNNKFEILNTISRINSFFVCVTLISIFLSIPKADFKSFFGRDDTGIISSAESSGVCTNSDGESSKNGTLTNSSTEANLSTDSACQNVTEMLKR